MQLSVEDNRLKKAYDADDDNDDSPVMPPSVLGSLDEEELIIDSTACLNILLQL